MTAAATFLAAGKLLGAGSWALLIVSLLGVVTVLLYRSMRNHLRKVPRTFEPPPDPPADTSPHPR